jgi:hypothetical protein
LALPQIIALINDSSVWWHVLGTALIVIALPCIAAVKQPASFAFTSFADNSEETGVYNPGGANGCTLSGHADS